MQYLRTGAYSGLAAFFNTQQAGASLSAWQALVWHCRVRASPHRLRVEELGHGATRMHFLIAFALILVYGLMLIFALLHVVQSLLARPTPWLAANAKTADDR
jgi:hypothetical protein